MRHYGIKKIVITAAFMGFLTTVFLVPCARAQTDLNDSIKAGALVDTIHDVKQKEIMEDGEIFRNLGDKFNDVADSNNNALLVKWRMEYARKNKKLFLDPLIDAIAKDRVVSLNLADEVKKLLDDTTRFLFLAHTQVENASSDSDYNPFATPYIQMEADLLEKYNNIFCVPESLNASEDCAARKDVAPPYENFIDFFTAERTWTDDKIVGVLLMARRFFGGASDKIFIGQGVSDPGNFISNQGGIAQANMRMAILNDLAAWRAPTSKVSNRVGGLFLQLLVPTGMIPTLDYDALCVEPKKTAIIANVCAMTMVEVKNGKKERVISQAAIDKIMQFDYMLSRDFYKQIDSGNNVPDGPIRKVGVYLKAQQVAQDYRALRLLQMKVAATAMNIMNGK